MLSSFCYFFLIKISVSWWLEWTNGLNFSSWLAPTAFTTCIFGSLYQKVRYILPCQLNFELVSWLPLANCWQIRGKQRPENVLACFHSRLCCRTCLGEHIRGWCTWSRAEQPRLSQLRPSPVSWLSHPGRSEPPGWWRQPAGIRRNLQLSTA